MKKRLKIILLLKYMRKTRTFMLVTAQMLKDAGYSLQADEMSGAAKILDTWITGVEGDQPK